MKYENGMILDGTKVVYQPTSKVIKYVRRVQKRLGGGEFACHILVCENINVFVFEWGEVVERSHFEIGRAHV